MSEREWCNCESAWMEMGYCLANCEVAEPALTTPPAGEEGEALIEWLTGLVNEGGDAPIEIPVRDMKLLLSLLSSPRVEERMRFALEKAAEQFDAKALTNETFAALCRAALSPQGG